MIPIVAIANLINGIIAGAIALILFVRYLQKTKEHQTTRGIFYFIALYISISFMWLIYSAPGIMITDLRHITILQSLGDIFVYLNAIIGILIAFTVLGRKDTGTIVSLGIGTGGLIYILGNLFSFNMRIQEIIPPYIYWHPEPNWMQTMTGIIAGLSALVFISTFLTLGLKNKNNTIIYNRSLYLAGGMFFMLLAALSFFIFSTGGFFMTLISAVFNIGGLVLLLFGIYTDMRLPNEENEQLNS